MATETQAAALKSLIGSELNVTAPTIRNFEVVSAVVTRRRLLALYLWTVNFNIIVSSATTGSSNVFVDIDDQAMEDTIIESLDADADDFTASLRSSLNVTVSGVYITNADDDDEFDDDEISTATASYIVVGVVLFLGAMGGILYKVKYGKQSKKTRGEKSLERGDSMDPVWFEEDNPPEIKMALESDEDPSTEVSEVSSTKQNDDEEPVPEIFIENEERTKGCGEIVCRQFEFSFNEPSELVGQPQEAGPPPAVGQPSEECPPTAEMDFEYMDQ